MPINRAQLHAQANFIQRVSTPQLGRGPDPGHQTTQQVHGVQRGDQEKEGVGGIGRRKIAEIDQLPPRDELPDQDDYQFIVSIAYDF